ncbi:MAG: hypothetical protein ACK5C6_09885, partial [Roseiflexaceae bacterium]
MSVIWHPSTSHAAQNVCHPDQPSICIDTAFLSAWQRGGGLEGYGFPIASATQMRIGSDTYDVQLFERARIELHRINNSTTIMLGRLGAEVMVQQGLRYDTSPARTECRYVPETQHNICGEFLRYWQRAASSTMTSVQRWGYPLSEAQTMTLEDGTDVIAQWFERGRFELHSNTNPPQIMVTRLGALFPDISNGTSPIERLRLQLNVPTLSNEFANQFVDSPLLDMRMLSTKSTVDQMLVLYLDRLEKQLYNNYINQVKTELGDDVICKVEYYGTGLTDTHSVSHCLYEIFNNPNFVIYNMDSDMYFSGNLAMDTVMRGGSSNIDLLGGRLYQITNATYLEKFAIIECGFQGYTNLADFSFQKDSSYYDFDYVAPNQLEIEICATLNFAMQLAGVNELRLVKSSLSKSILNQLLQQTLFSANDPSTATDIAYIPDSPHVIINPSAQMPTTTSVTLGQTFPVTATMSLFWDTDVYVSLPTALDKMHVTVHGTEFAQFDDAYKWYRYPRWVEPYMTITADDVTTDSINRLPQMTRVGTGIFEGQYVAYQHLLRNNRSYYIVVKGHN